MPDWSAPFYVPKMTTKEFLEMKAKYVAKHGYQITIPGFEDVIHLKTEEPMTQEEWWHWKQRDYDKIPPVRRAEIEYMKKRKKEKFLAMLASPMPTVLKNHASIMTAMDDTQDAMATLACIGRVAVKFLPSTLSKIITGPVGWVMAATDCLNLAIETQRSAMTPMSSKRWKDKCTDLNPFSKKARAKRAKQITKAMPTKGNVIEALQVTDNIFGVGISLGQLMSLPVDIVAGNVRRFIMGQPVTVKYPIPDVSHWGRAAMKTIRGVGLYHGIGHGSDEVFETQLLITNNLAQQVMRAERTWDPIEEIVDIADIETRAPSPDNPLTLEIYEESGLDPENYVGWPGLDKKWATTEQIHSVVAPVAKANLDSYCSRNNRSLAGFIGAINAVESSMLTYENIEGKGSVSYDHIAASKAIHRLQSAGYYFPDPFDPTKQAQFVSWLEQHEAEESCPTTKEILDYFEFTLALPLSTWSPY